MRGRVARKAFAIGSAGVDCARHSRLPTTIRADDEGGAAPTDLKIVEQVQIDENGTEVKPRRRRAAPRSRRRRQGAVPTGVPGHGGRAQRARRRAGNQHQERHPARGRQAQRRQPGLPGAVEDVRHRGRSAEGHSGRTADHQRRLHHRPDRTRVLRRDERHRRRVQPGRPGRRHRVGHQRHALGEGLEDVLPRPWPTTACRGPRSRTT